MDDEADPGVGGCIVAALGLIAIGLMAGLLYWAVK
jgi:hypothetical protein